MFRFQLFYTLKLGIYHRMLHPMRSKPHFFIIFQFCNYDQTKPKSSTMLIEGASQTSRNHLVNRYAKFSKQLTFCTPWYSCNISYPFLIPWLVFRKVLRTHLGWTRISQKLSFCIRTSEKLNRFLHNNLYYNSLPSNLVFTIS